MRVGVVDIGTNSMRLLVAEGWHGGIRDVGRWVEVTGLGRGVDSNGRLAEDAMARTLAVLEQFGQRMTELEVERRYAMATSATRDAANREEFLESCEGALGVRPEVISGAREGILAFDGATADFVVEGPTWVSDIGGGSTEIVMYDDGFSIQMGSVRLTDRLPSVYPLPESLRYDAMEMARMSFTGYDFGEMATHIGVAGTWTSLAAIAQDLPSYQTGRVHGHSLRSAVLDELVETLCGLTLEETEAIPSLDPKRAPVIRAGAIVAQAVVGALDVDSTLISVKDTLDGAVLQMLDVTFG